jgi:hypothetical protein
MAVKAAVAGVTVVPVAATALVDVEGEVNSVAVAAEVVEVVAVADLTVPQQPLPPPRARALLSGKASTVFNISFDAQPMKLSNPRASS